MEEIEDLLKNKESEIEQTTKKLADTHDIKKKEELLNKFEKLLKHKNFLLNSIINIKKVIEEDNLDDKDNKIIKEAIIDGHNFSMDLKSMKLFSKQMEKSVCKINKSETLKGTGFICKISKEKEIYHVLITCHHVLDENDIKIGKIIDLSFIDNETTKKKFLKINKLRKTYTNQDFDVTIIEIKKNDGFDENNMLSIDERIYSNNLKDYYYNKYIYLLHYPRGENIKFSSDKIMAIKDNKIFHLCPTEKGSSGAPIINLENLKVIGVHFGNTKIEIEKKGNKEKKEKIYNLGTVLNGPIYEFFKLKTKKNNKIILKMEIDKNDINKNIYFLDNDLYTDDIIFKKEPGNSLKELNESNVKLWINEETHKYAKFFKPKKEGIYTIKLELDVKITDCCQMFHGCTNIISIDLSNFDSENVTNMNYMFSGCKNLKNIDISGLNTDNVTKMSYMFYMCWNIKDLDLSSFNTEKVKDMSGLFCQCQMKNLDISFLNTKNLINMSHMFYGMKNLDNLNFENFNTKNVNNMSGLFASCQNLNNLDLSFFDTKNVITMSCMFFGCTNLKTINLSKFNTEKVNSMSSMFLECINLSEINLSSFNTRNVTDMMQMFGECQSLVNLDLSSFNTSNTIYMNNMFRGCSKLMNLNIMNFNCQNKLDSLIPNNPFSSSIISLMKFEMFQGCKNLVNVTVSYMDFHNKSFMEDLTRNSKKLNNIRVFQKNNEVGLFFQ